MEMSFLSEFKMLGPVQLPVFSGIRVMMMPIVIGDINSVPINGYDSAILDLFRYCPEHSGKVGYITIDEKKVEAGTTHRRAGVHVDGVCYHHPGAWGGGGSWSSKGTGAITVSNPAGCVAWAGVFNGEPGPDGECDHLQLPKDMTKFKESVAYWFGGLCVHESIQQPKTVNRQFVRLSLPSTAPWFEGYSQNPLGVQPTGPILPQRQYM